MLRPLPIPGLLVTGTDTEVGKTTVAGAIAGWFRRRGFAVAVCKPVASGCVRRREGGVRVAGVVINRYPTDTPGAAEETNPRAIEKWGNVPVLCHVPDEKIGGPDLPPGIIAAIHRVDWEALARRT